MTTSVVFDASCTYETEYQWKNGDVVEPYPPRGMSNIFFPRQALERLRILKTRESGDQQVIPNIVGRTNGAQMNYDGDGSPSYYEYTMRRKAGVLMGHTNKNNLSSKSSYAAISSSGKSKFRHITNARIRKLRESQQCENTNVVIKPSTNSGVFGGKAQLIFNPNIPFQDKL